MVRISSGRELHTINLTQEKGVLMRRIKQDGEGKCQTTLCYYFLKYCICIYTAEYFLSLDVIQNVNFPQLIVNRILHQCLIFVSLLLIYSIIK